MDNFEILVYGPAGGGIAFQIPGASRISGDSLFLNPSHFEITPSSSVIKLDRLTTDKGYCIRTSIYKQVYEHGMQRLGDSYGASFNFYNTFPHSKNVKDTLLELLALIESRCTNNGVFSKYEQFKDFTQGYLSECFDGIKSQIHQSDDEFNGIIYLPILEKSSASIEVGSLTDKNTEDAIEWFATDSTSAPLKSLIIYPSGSGRPGKLYEALDQSSFISSSEWAMYENIINHKKSYEDITSKNEELKLNLNLLQRENNELFNKCSQLENLSDALNKSNQILKNEVSSLTGKINSLRQEYQKNSAVSSARAHQKNTTVRPTAHHSRQTLSKNQYNQEEPGILIFWIFAGIILIAVIIALLFIIYFI